MKSRLVPVACLILLTACVEQEMEPAAPGAVEARGAYAGALAREGRSAVIFDNGDVILVDSPRLFAETLAARICALTACDPTGAIADRTVTVPDGGSFSGHERDAAGACVRVSYDCVNGRLVP